ncbi:MAG: hypothetical protein EXR62_14100 [Chloroflexi bacterium]|nr:hypothetical protein [Chloroflexota bacterium]
MSTVAIKQSDRTIVFSMAERDQIREHLKGRMRWDSRTNRWQGIGNLDELVEVLKQAGYEVKLI